MGLLAPQSLNVAKLAEEGKWCPAHAIRRLEIDSEFPRITLPEAKIAGDRVLFDQLGGKIGSSALELVTPQQIRGGVEHFRASSGIWRFLTGRIDLALRNTDERATWANFPAPEV